MDRFLKGLDFLEDFFITAAMILMTVFVLIQIALRYVIIGSAPWTEEFARYLMVTSTFFGAALASKRKVHIQVAILHLFKLDTKILNYQEILKNIISFVACALMTFILYPALKNSYLRGLRSPTGDIGMYIPLALVFVGLVLMSFHHGLYFVRDIWRLARTRGGREN
jgi:TRAP-type C4-dicarboxylate transport system permease small subunit